jgi:hypothetical protein
MSIWSRWSARLRSTDPASKRVWAAGILVALIAIVSGLWWFWQGAPGQQPTGCAFRTPGIAEAAADYNAYLRERCGFNREGDPAAK